MMNGLSNGAAAPRAATHITVKTERSLRTKVLQSSLKPFGTTLVKPSKPTPTGSPELKPHEQVFDYCNVRQRQIDGIRLYDVNPRSTSTRQNFIPAQIADLKTEAEPVRTTTTSTSGYALEQIRTHEQEHIGSQDFAKRPSRSGAARKQIYYFAGGGFQSPASAEHWKFVAHICHELNDFYDVPTTVTLVSYPLAPNNPARQSLAALERLYRSILPQTPPSTPAQSAIGIHENISKLSLKRTQTSYIAPEEDIIFMGDSAGANVLLSLTMKILATDPRSRAPAALFLISPPVDMRNTNPEMPKVDKRDPLLSLDFVNKVAKEWCGDVDMASAYVSPLLGDVEVFAKRKVFIHGVIGGNDVLAPDAKLFMDKCKANGVKGEWLVWEKQMHCFPLAFSYKMLPEANEAVSWIVDVLKRTTPANIPV